MNLVRMKGNKSGIVLSLTPDAGFEEIFTEIKSKISASKDFFSSGVNISVSWGDREFSAKQADILATFLAGYGLKWDRGDLAQVQPTSVVPKTSLKSVVEPEKKKLDIDGYEAPALVINKTLRGGTRVIFDGVVILFGDMNPGSEIIAGRDIIIHGICRGLVHAGAFGEREARIVANKLKPVQIRIADCIARAPDGGEWPDNGNVSEMAFIDNGVLTIKSTRK